MKLRWWYALAGTTLVIAVFYIGLHLRDSAITSRLYRIGFEDDPPFHFRDENGNPAGLAVDIVREAAGRIGIRLQWIYEPRSSEAALRGGSVDLWPIMTIRDERKAFVYLTDPYRESESCLLVRADRPYRQLVDLNGLAVSYNGQPLSLRMLNDNLPRAKLLIIEDHIKLVEAVCRGEADAAFMDELSVISALLGGAVCNGQKLRVINVPEARGLLGIGATFAAAEAADAIRSEISIMAEEGKLAALFAKWHYFTGRSMELNEALIQAQRRQRYLFAAMIGALTLLLFTAWLALRIRHQRNRAIRAEEARRTSEERYAGLFNNMTEGVALHRITYDPKGRPVNYQLLDVNPSYENILSCKRLEVINRLATDVYGTTEAPFLAEYTRCNTTAAPSHFETYFQPLDKHFAISVAPMGRDSFATIFSDITGRKRDEEEKARLEEHLQQAQRMESIGRLAGGVAHDFNNLLTVINGYTDLLIENQDLKDAQRAQLSQIRKAGLQAASLTQQLLAFSRRQIIRPRVLNLNSVVQETQQMLQRLVGEDIELTTLLDPGLASIMADPGQMHQVLMNLVVNSRDAMPKGGKLMIETFNVELDASYVAIHPEATPGPCVLLSVSDTGMGIDPENLQHIFEPFFTTKGKGEGTGLGLSMVYGIVQQSHGWIWAYSEPGKGTTFKVYFPQIRLQDTIDEPKSAGSELAAGVETILLVEDQENVRALAASVLRKCGYQVLEAEKGEQALDLARQHSGTIHLLLTDVVLPGITGKELADRLTVDRRDLKVLFSSGYTENVIVNRGVLKPGIFFLAKPYTPSVLAEKVREVLDAKGNS